MIPNDEASMNLRIQAILSESNARLTVEDPRPTRILSRINLHWRKVAKCAADAIHRSSRDNSSRNDFGPRFAFRLVSDYSTATVPTQGHAIAKLECSISSRNAVDPLSSSRFLTLSPATTHINARVLPTPGDRPSFAETPSRVPIQ